MGDDIDLVRIVQDQPGSREANDAVAELVRRHTRNVTATHARRGRLANDEIEAIAAEGIWRAAQRFDVSRGAGFGTLAHVITGRMVVDYLRRQDVQTGRTAGRAVVELRGDDTPTVPLVRLDEMAADEAAARFKEMLTPLEASVFDGRRRGLNFAEIAAAIGRSIKAVDNAAVRIRAKFVGQGPAAA